MENRVCQLFNISKPIIQGGMIWCSGWKLASAVSNSGGLGLIGSGSMYPEVLREHIRKCKQATSQPFGVNLPLLYKHAEENIQVILEEKVPIVFTSAGNPSTWTSLLKKNGITVVHVVSNLKFAVKAMNSGVDAIVAEGFEAGGHNGKEETTTMALIPYLRKHISIPLLAAGGIADGNSMLAAFALGAEGVQIGSLFATSEESSAHPSFKEAILQAKEGDTQLVLKQLTPVRLLRNEFYLQVKSAEERGASSTELQELLGKGRARIGMFEGNMKEGELEIGQVSAAISSIEPVSKIMDRLWSEFLYQKGKLQELNFNA
jgi:enoyl-[acyl-carrier protein] reductase II